MPSTAICAERTAVFAAVLAGAGKITAVAVSGPDGATTPPCGACRQVLAEFGAPDVPLSYARADGGIALNDVSPLDIAGFVTTAGAITLEGKGGITETGTLDAAIALAAGAIVAGLLIRRGPATPRDTELLPIG